MADRGVWKVTVKNVPATFKSLVWTNFSFYNVDGTNQIIEDAVRTKCLVKVKY